jgi:hypothetical protein
MKNRVARRARIEKLLEAMPLEERSAFKRGYFQSHLEICRGVYRMWLIVSLLQITFMIFWKSSGGAIGVTLGSILLAFISGFRWIRVRQKLNALDKGQDPDLEI